MNTQWIEKKLGEVCVFLNRGISPRYVDSQGVRVLNQKCIRNNAVNYEFARRHDVVAKSIGADRFIRPADVLINSTGTGTLGRIAQIRGEVDEPTTVDSHVTIARPRPETFYPDFFGYMLMTIEDEIKKAGEGCGGQTELARSVLSEKFSVKYPVSIPEQKRIAGILKDAFGNIYAAKSKVNESLKTADELFSSCLDGIQAERQALGDLIRITTGKLDANAAVESGMYPFFTCSKDTYRINHFAFDCEAILLAGNNAVGDFNVKHYKGKFNAYQRTYVITISEKDKITYRFLYYQLLQNLKKFKQQAVGAGTKFLKVGIIRDMEISVPDIVEQHRVASVLDALRESTDLLYSTSQRKLAALDELKKSLLHQAFSGNL